MISFKQYLAERTITPFHITDLSTEKALSMISKHCSNAIPMLKSGSLLWRGDASMPENPSSFLIDLTASERESQNTSNYYTVILDNNPLMKGYPKRSKSLICSESLRVARNFGDGGPVFVVIPFNSSAIGHVGSKDMWNTEVTLFGDRAPIAEVNSNWYSMEDYGYDLLYFSEWERLAAMLKKRDPMVIKQLCMVFETLSSQIEPSLDNFLKYVFDAYSPKNLGFEKYTTKNIPQGLDSEVWVDGKVILIEKSEYENNVNDYI